MPEPKLPDDLVYAIGRVTINGMRLEGDLVMYYWQQRDLNRPMSANEKPRSDNFSHAVRELRKYVRATFRGTPFLVDLLAAIHAAQQVQTERHTCVHGVWSAHPVRGSRHSVMSFRDPSNQVHLSIADVHDLADRIHKCRARLMNLIPLLDIPLQAAGKDTGRVLLSPEQMTKQREEQPVPGIAWPK